MAHLSRAPLSQLAIVIPAYNEAKRIGATLDELRAFLAEVAIDAALIVVDDGSTDGTTAVVRAHAPAAQVIRLTENRGKGAAVRAGMAAATAPLILCCDADLATPITELPRFLATIARGADIAVGSRHVRGATIDPPQPRARRILGAGFRTLSRLVLRLPVRDPMCGFKLFRLDAARWLFPRTRIDDYACDIEVMYLARERYEVVELPVRWRHVDGSRVRIHRASWRAARDIVRIAAHGRDRPEATAPPSGR